MCLGWVIRVVRWMQRRERSSARAACLDLLPCEVSRSWGRKQRLRGTRKRKTETAPITAQTKAPYQSGICITPPSQVFKVSFLTIEFSTMKASTTLPNVNQNAKRQPPNMYPASTSGMECTCGTREKQGERMSVSSRSTFQEFDLPVDQASR